MKIERIKKSHKKEIVIGGLILASIVSAITLVTTKAKFRVTQDIKLVNGTVNYKPYDFKIMAMYQQNDIGEYTEINEMPTSGYIVNEEKSYCTTDNKTQVKGKIKTENGNHVISNLKKSDKCYIWFDKKTVSNVTELIVAVNPKDSETTFSGASKTDEGVFKVADGMYGDTSYYWRGAATTNHVVFANKCWRIVRINGDGSIRLIYNGTPSGITPNQTCPGNGSNSASVVMGSSNAEKHYATSSGSSNNSSYVGWTYTLSSQRPTLSKDANDMTTGGTESNAKVQTEKWFNNNSNFTDVQREQVAIGKFCNDRSVGQGSYSAAGSTFYYGAYKRTITDRQPTLSCPSGDLYELKVGTITADEVIYAGGWNANNSTYYLYNGQNYWTMTPRNWNSSNANVFIVQNDGCLNDYNVSNTLVGLRPVINLKSDVTFSSGNGTQNNPYIVD